MVRGIQTVFCGLSGASGISRIALCFIFLTASCRKAEEAPPSSPLSAARGTESLSMPGKDGLPPDARRRVSLMRGEERLDRQLMVIPAPAGFRPKVRGKRLELRITPRSSRMKTSTPLFLKIELQNIGDETFKYSAYGSLLKSRYASDLGWRLFAKGPDGQTRRLSEPWDIGGHQDDGRFISPEEAQSFQERGHAFTFLHVDLAPGETLVSLPRTPEDRFEGTPSEDARYVEVSAPIDFERPGIYEVQVEHTTEAWDPGRGDFEAKQTLVATPVRVEVVP